MNQTYIVYSKNRSAINGYRSALLKHVSGVVIDKDVEDSRFDGEHYTFAYSIPVTGEVGPIIRFKLTAVGISDLRQKVPTKAKYKERMLERNLLIFKDIIDGRTPTAVGITFGLTTAAIGYVAKKVVTRIVKMRGQDFTPPPEYMHDWHWVIMGERRVFLGSSITLASVKRNGRFWNGELNDLKAFLTKE